MPKNAALVLFVALVIAFSYWLGRHAAERATTTAERVPPPPAAPASAPPPASPAARKGMTWGVAADVETPEGIVLVGCHGEPATATGSCDADRGDTACSEARPLLCLKIDDTPAPTDLRRPLLDGAPPDDFYAGWAGGTVATTAPMPGTALKTREIADRACAAAFGDRWRLAEFHAGGRDQQPIAVTEPGSTQPRSVYPSGGGAFYAAGDPIRTSRFWVAIDDRPANCWD